MDSDLEPFAVVLPQKDKARFKRANRRRLSAPAIRTFLAIADLWGLTEDERRLVLGFPSPSIYDSWCKQAREHRTLTLNVDVLRRLSTVFGIHQALGVLFSNERDGVEWLRTPHNASSFAGHAPIDLVVADTEDALLTVRRFLDAARLGLYMAPCAGD